MLDDDDTEDEATDDDATENAYQMSDWMQPLETLSGIPGVELRLKWNGSINDPDHPCIAQWLKQHGQLISHLIAKVNISEGRLKLGKFAEAAASCRSMALTIKHLSDDVVDLCDLDAVAGSLQRLTCEPIQGSVDGNLRGTSTFNKMSQLVALHLHCEGLGDDKSWALTAKLTSLQQLTFIGCASGDPSPVSALTRLSSLRLNIIDRPHGSVLAPSSFSSLQPLSTLQQLGVLQLGSYACAATSLQGLAGLSNLKQLGLDFGLSGGMLRSLEGISAGVVEFSVMFAPGLLSLAGIEGCTSMGNLSLSYCGVSSLQPLRGLSSIKQLLLCKCCLTNLEGLNSMSLQFLTVQECSSLTQLSGVEHLSCLKRLGVLDCGNVTSLQPLSQLGECLQGLSVIGCQGVREEVLQLPHVQHTADVRMTQSNVREVVLAGGLRRVVAPPTFVRRKIKKRTVRGH
jgi:hypothetical protein